MNSTWLTLLFLALMVGAALAGMAIRTRLPEHHTSDSSRDAVLRSVGLVVTLSALVLGFIVNSAQTYYHAVEDQLTEIATNVSALDRILERLGPAAAPARQLLRQGIGSAVSAVWPGHESPLPRFAGGRPIEALEGLADIVESLPRGDPRQADLLNQANNSLAAIRHASLRLSTVVQDRAQTPLLAIVVSWLVIVFLGFGLVAPRTATAVISIFLSAIAATGALFLVLELFSPVNGLIQISPSVLESALPATVGQ